MSSLFRHGRVSSPPIQRRLPRTVRVPRARLLRRFRPSPPPSVPTAPDASARWPALLRSPAATTALVVTASLVLFSILASALGVFTLQVAGIVAAVSVLITAPLALTVRRYHRQMAHQNQRLASMATELRSQTEAYERRAAERAQTVATLAHELKNPLGNVREYAKTIQAEADNAGLVREFAGLMEQEASEVLATATDLLDSLSESRLDLTLRRERLSLGALAEQVVRANRPRAEAKQQDLSFYAEPNMEVEGDPHGLHVIVANLLSNAIKYTPEGGAVRLRVQSEWSAEGLEARVEVEDNGPGLSAQDTQHVFEPFSRGDARPTGGEQQTGLGLAISRRLAERHGGRLWSEPTEGSGARFVLALPLA